MYGLFLSRYFRNTIPEIDQDFCGRGRGSTRGDEGCGDSRAYPGAQGALGRLWGHTGTSLKPKNITLWSLLGVGKTLNMFDSVKLCTYTRVTKPPTSPGALACESLSGRNLSLLRPRVVSGGFGRDVAPLASVAALAKLKT